MAGHRHRHGKPMRSASRQQRMRKRLSSAATAEEQLAAAFDWLRMSARHLADAAERGRVLRDAAEFLARMAGEIDGRPQ